MFPAAAAALALAFVAGPVRCASAESGAPKVPSSRWLLVIETSSAMENRAKAVEKIAGSMLASGMNGQMRDGDTVGIWTFNEDLHSGEFPLVEWSSSGSKGIASRAYSFLATQKFGRHGRLEKATPDIQRIIKDSDYITVLLMTSGREPIHGTPFDDKINGMFQSWQKDEDKAGFPFVTALRAEHGAIISCAVTVPPWPLDLPPLSPGLLRAWKLAEAKPAAPPPAPPPAVFAPPLILSGKKAAPAPTPALSAPAAANPPPAPAAVTNPAPAPEPAPAAAPASPALPPPPAASAAPPAEKPAAVVPSVPAPTAPAAAAPAPAPAPASTAAAPQSSSAHPPSSATHEFESPAVPREPATHGGKPLILMLGMAGLVLAGVILGVLLVLIRQSSASKRVSLITRSLERDKDCKPPTGKPQ
jgi:hypothetical protein